MGKKDKKTGQPKPAGQQKPTPTPALLFHESLGKELTQKFSDITNNPVRRPSVATYFASGIIEEDVKVIAKTTVIATVEKVSDGDSVKSVENLPTDLKDAITPASVEESSPTEKEPKKKSAPGKVYSLSDMNAFQSIEALVARHGRMTHMGVRDHNYDFFLNKSRTGVISYRLVDNKVAVISGDPICPVAQYSRLLEEFGHFCKDNKWQWAVQGGSKEMADIAKEHEWTTVHYGRERALNVQTNPVLLGSEGKRIRTQCKQLQKTVSIGIHVPAYNRDPDLEHQIVEMYDNWRNSRNTSRSVQAYVTVFDLMSLHRLMMFVYTRDERGKLLGFAALRRLREGYHIDPITVDPDAPRGMTDLLLISSMALLKESNITRLVLGVEPLDDLGEITGMSRALETLTRKSHKLISAELPLGGKKGFNDRFRPEEAFEEQLFMIYPNSPSIKQSVAMAHFANIHLHEAVKQRVAREREKRRRSSDPEMKTEHNGESAESVPIAVERVARPASCQRTCSDTVTCTHARRESDDKAVVTLSTPPRQERASSRIRFFRRSSDDERLEARIGEMSLAEGRKSEEQHALLSPGSRPRASSRASSRIRLFRRSSSDAEGKESTIQDRQSEESGHLVPPARERGASRSSSPFRLFRRKSSETDVKTAKKENGTLPMPFAGLT